MDQARAFYRYPPYAPFMALRQRSSGTGSVSPWTSARKAEALATLEKTRLEIAWEAPLRSAFFSRPYERYLRAELLRADAHQCGDRAYLACPIFLARAHPLMNGGHPRARGRRERKPQ